MKIFVTGAAGFIGFHLVKALAGKGHEIVGFDNINDYYDVELKYARLRESGINREHIIEGEYAESTLIGGYRFVKGDLTDLSLMERLFKENGFDLVVNLAAQAGVRYSITNPHAYVESNIVGFVNLLECCRHYPVKHLLYASSSSVYGGNTKVPFSESDPVDQPVSLYAATKKSNELMAHVYAKLYGVASTGLRFFTVYGPWGRPDMAPMLFTKSILAGEAIKVFNNGNLSRDFTYIDDIIEGVVNLVERAPKGEIPAEVYNIGCGHPMQLMDFIGILEEKLGKKAMLNMLPMQAGDVYTTYADTTKLAAATGYAPSTPLTDGIGEFVKWYRECYL